MKTTFACPHCGQADLPLNLGETDDFGPIEVGNVEQWAALTHKRQQFIGREVMAAILVHCVYDCPAVAKAAGMPDLAAQRSEQLGHAVECGATSPMGYVCNRQPGHPDPHEHQIIEDEGTPTEHTHTIASWPTLTVVP